MAATVLGHRIQNRWRPVQYQWWFLECPFWLAVFTAWCLLGARCIWSQPPVVHPRPGLDVEWSKVTWILANKCTGCHRAGAEEVDFSTYEKLLQAEVDGERLIVPGDPDASLLWQQVCWNVEGRPGSSQADEPAMPKDRLQWLTRGQLATIRTWIEQGAKKYSLPGACQPRPLSEIDFPSARQCGACHPRQYEQWSRSMHAYAQHSPVMEAFVLTLVERTGGTIGTFCTRCHTPIGIALGENESLRNVHRSRIAMEGITCVVCHRRKDGVYKASGRLSVASGDALTECVYGPFDGGPSGQVGTHPSRQRPYLRTSQFCAECHDVFGPTGVRLEEAFSEWLNSPAAREGTTCQLCHMGPVQGVPIPYDHRPLGRAAVVPGVPEERLPLRRLSDHTFAGPDYSLLPDTEFPHKLDWMYEQDYRDRASLTPYQQRTLTELRIANRRQLEIASRKRYELLRHAARIDVRHPVTAAVREAVSIRVDVKSLFNGHNFPTGFSAERQCWVFIELVGPDGRVIYRSGDVDSNGDLRDQHSRDVRLGKLPADVDLLNLQNKFTALAQKGTETQVILSVNRFVAPLSFVRPATGSSQSFGRPPGFRVAKTSLPPLGRTGRTYRIRLGEIEGTYLVRVRLLFRNLPPTLLDHIGIPQLKHRLETVVIDSYDGEIRVGCTACRDDAASPLSPAPGIESISPPAPATGEQPARQGGAGR